MHSTRIMVVKSVSLFGRELFRIERNRSGEFSYTFLDGSSFVDNGKYMDLYLTNPVLSTIVNFASQYYSQMKIVHLTKDNRVIENSPYVNLLNTPNYFQSKEDFFFQQMVFLSVTGTDLIYQIKAFTNDIPKAIYNLIPTELDYKEIQKIKKFIVTEKDIKAFEEQIIEYTLDSQTYYLKLKDIIPTFDLSNGLVNNSLLLSHSRVKGVAKVLNNIDENLKAKNVNLQMTQKYLGNNASDGNNAQIQEKDRNSIERVISNKSLILTNQANIDVKHLVSDMKKLFLDEQFSDDANKVLLAFGMNKNVLNYFAKDSTFENQNQGLISYIQNQIQVTADNTMNSLSQSWGLFAKGEKLKASYDHLPVMQSVINSKIATLTEFQNMVKIAKENGTITDADAISKTKDLMIKLNL